MNRAFVKDNDGWNRCKFKMESCMMADEAGGCLLDRCSQDPSFVPPKAGQDMAPGQAAGKAPAKALEKKPGRAATKAAEQPTVKPAKKSAGKF